MKLYSITWEGVTSQQLGRILSAAESIDAKIFDKDSPRFPEPRIVVQDPPVVAVEVHATGR